MYKTELSRAAELAAAIQKIKGGKMSRTSTGYQCRCPAHEDNDPSLSVADGQNGKPVLHCHAGCSQDAVIGALRDMGLWSASKPNVQPIFPRGIRPRWDGKPLSKIYPYTLPNGDLAGYVVRYEDQEGKVTIPYFQLDGDTWKSKGPGKPSPLYGIPSLSKEGPVFVVEGEKACDALTKMGHACVTSQGGAEAATKADWSPLHGRDVVIWRDYDAPGEKYARAVQSMLRGKAKTIREVDVDAMNPDSIEGFDAADWDGVGDIVYPDLPKPVPAYVTGNYRTTDSGSVKALSQNLAVLLGTPKLTDTLGWNVLADKPAWRKQPPFLTEFRAEIHDQDAAEFAFWASDNLGADFKTTQAMEAIEVHAKRHPFHPVQEYLQTLRWDGISRIDHWLSDAFGVPETEYHSGVARSFLISAVARAMNPGCQVDTMLVLMGDQGLGKTSAARALVPDFGMYAETTESPANKDFYQALRGKWIVEIGELHSFKNADWTKIKQMLSAKVDTYRPSYGHFTKDFPRQCIFIGTTNDETWNRDSTGARRFWPINCIEVNKDYITAQRDQLWAEAFERFKAGDTWWDVVDQAEATEAIAETDPWDEPIAKFIALQKKGVFITAYQVLMEMGGETVKISKRDETRVTEILRRMKLKHKKVTYEGMRKWVWIT